MTRLRFLIPLVLAFLATAPSATQPLPIRIGLTTPLTGPDASYGQGLRLGVELAVARANAAGGLSGRPLELLALDDGGDPQRAAANARQLLQRGVIAITGVHGARSTVAVADVLMPRGAEGPIAALVAPATSADLLRDPPRPGVFHLRAGTAEETSVAMLHLDTIGVTRYAVLAQADPLGESGRDGMLIELSRIGTRPVASERLATGASPAQIQRAIDQLCAAQPEAVILAVDEAPAYAAVTAARAQRCASHYLVLSETGAALAERAPGATGPHPMAGLLVTQVTPHPNQIQHPLVAEYQRALAVHGAAQGSYPSLEGYIAARAVQEAIRSCSHDIGRECLLQALVSRTLELPGLRVQFGIAQRQQHPFVEITMLDSEGHFRR